ncbi:MAG: hypothetical protein EOP62_12950 [Sphingomonadales bacterium]|nr:MAG: hypothetical protein EOP62_12950 [Sphingomonadales bacterium]
MSALRALPILLTLTAALPAAAQDSRGAGVEIATDEKRRGLSWSDGRMAAAADVYASSGPVEASARLVSTRDSARHGGADMAADLQAGLVTDAGPFRLRGQVTAHLFAGARGRLDYAEVGASGSYSLGPLQIAASAIYAPDQSAIGGDNLYLHLGASAGIPASPFTLSAAIGRSSGSTDDPLRAARLRPLGNYSDWRIGLDYIQTPFTLGVEYVGTDIDTRAFAPSPYADARHSGDRLLARVRIDF